MPLGTILELNPAKGMFIVALGDGQHAVFTLYSHAALAPGATVSGALQTQGSEWLLDDASRQHFEAFGESGPTSLEECRRLLWPAGRKPPSP